jgi:hypothetical protein
MKDLITIASVLVLAGCSGTSSEISTKLATLFAQENASIIDLAELGPQSWERVCVLTPYTTNDEAERVLGFKWNAEGETSIASSDGINVLVFVRGSEVVAFAEHSRNAGDLSQINPRCLQRDKAKLVRHAGSQGWVYLVEQKSPK